VSVRERNRYFTVALVFLLAFVVLGGLAVRASRVLALSFTFRPAGATSQTYNGGIQATQKLGFAFDTNLATAATTYTNADFSGDGSPPDTVLSESGKWAVFQQTTAFIKNVGLYVLREGTLNGVNQWSIEYTRDGGSIWITIDDPGASGDNPAKSTVGSMIPYDVVADADLLKNDLKVRTLSKQLLATDAKLEIFDIRVEAEWDTSSGGSSPLIIDTDYLPMANKFLAYDELVEASGGNTPYTWEIVSGALPPQFDPPANTGSPNYDMRIQYDGLPIYTTSGNYPFTVKVTDSSDPEQIYQTDLSILVAGLSIDPPGPGLPTPPPQPVKGVNYGGKQFDPKGSGAPYYWCRTGSLPNGMSILEDGGSNEVEFCPGGGDPDTTSAFQAGYLTLSGKPKYDGEYNFTLKVRRVDEVSEHNYVLEVLSGNGVILQPKNLKGYIKGVLYGGAGLEPEFIQAVAVDSIGAAGNIYVMPNQVAPGTDPSFDHILIEPGNTLALVPGGDGSLPILAKDAFRIRIEGTVAMAQAPGDYFFEAGIRDYGNAQGPDGEHDKTGYTLTILERKTLLIMPPPAAANLPTDSVLNFVVFAEGGAPSTKIGTTVDVDETPYYNYEWEVVPVDGTNSPALGTSTGTFPALAVDRTATATVVDEITFRDSSGKAVAGTYDIFFWAQDVLRRQNLLNPAYKFTPAKVRIKVLLPAGQTMEKNAGNPALLRQEQFR
jgi:hypothetical protein